jgi:hypothetical protein
MLVSFPTKAASAVRPLASSTDWRFGIKGLLDAKRLPLHHAHRHGLVDIFAVFVETGIVNGYTNVSGCPRCRGMRIANSTHIPCLEVLFTFFANGQSRVWKLDAEHLLEPGRSKGQNIL